MSCPSHKRLAAACSGEDVVAEVHAASCDRCAPVVGTMAALIAFARRAPTVTLSAIRRARVRAAVMAESDAMPMPNLGRGRGIRIGVLVVCAAAAGFAIATWRTPVQAVVLVGAVRDRVVVSPAPQPHVVPAPAPRVVLAPPPPPAPPPIVQRDPVSRRPAAYDTHVQIAPARQDQREAVVEGDVWTADHRASLRAFELGWTALREQHYADAIAAFDRANDPSVAEDAAYWAALASERGGNHVDAMHRFRQFAASFPDSVRADDVRSALARLAP